MHSRTTVMVAEYFKLYAAHLGKNGTGKREVPTIILLGTYKFSITYCHSGCSHDV